MDGYSMPQRNMAGDSLDPDKAAARFIRRALDEIDGVEPTDADAIAHIANAERELRAALRALRMATGDGSLGRPVRHKG